MRTTGTPSADPARWPDPLAAGPGTSPTPAPQAGSAPSRVTTARPERGGIKGVPVLASV